MESSQLEQFIIGYMRTFPELREWLYSDEEYFNQELWPLKNTCKKEAHRPLVCMLKKGHPGPHISLDIWQEGNSE